MKWNWKWAATISTIVLFLIFDHNPAALKSLLKLVSNQGVSASRKEKLTRAGVLGRLKHAEQVALETKSRLSALEQRCIGELGDLLDAAFLSNDPSTGILNLNPLRKSWFELRRSVPEWSTRHDQFISEIRRYMGSLTNENLEEASELAEESLIWSAGLDEEISRKIALVPRFDAIARRLLLQQQSLERRNSR